MLMASLENAIAKHRQGQWIEADQLYQQLLQREPANLDALRLRSLLAEQTGNLTQAITLAQQAIALKPNRAELYLTLANPLLSVGKTDEAIETLRKALQLDRRNVDAYLLLGDAYQQRKDFTNAIAAYQKALQLNRSIPEVYNNLANAQTALGELSQAVAHYEKAISLQADYLDAYFNLGNAYRLLGRLDEATQTYRTLLQRAPDYAKASTMLGMVLKAQGQFLEAEAMYRQASEKLAPHSPEQAITQFNWGNLHQDQKQYAQAEAHYRQSLAIAPHQPTVLSSLALALAEQGQATSAQQIYAQLMAQEPHNPLHALHHTLCLPVLYQNTAEIQQWRQQYQTGLDAFLQQTHAPLSPQSLIQLADSGFYLAYQGQNDLELQQKRAHALQSLCPPLSQLTGNTASEPLTEAPSSHKIKIGFISKHFSPQHTIGKLMQGIIQHLSREQFEVSVFCIGPVQGNATSVPAESSTLFYTLDERNLAAAIQQLQQAQLDILYYADIGMDPFTTLLAQYRLATVQCVGWGHPVTTGMESMDYFISSQLLEPENAQAHYSEKLVALQNLPTYYQRPAASTETTPIKSLRQHFGFAPDAHVYLCPQSLFKIHPDFDPILRGILEQDPQAVIGLLEHTVPSLNEQLQQRFQAHMPEMAHRVQWVPRQNHAQFLQLLGCADVLLDPPGFGGGNTSYEAFALGIPIITLPGAFMRGRVTLGCYQTMSLTECIAHNADEYILKAVQFGTQPATRQAVSTQIMNACHHLYEDADVLRELEAFFMQALAQATQGEPLCLNS